MLGFMMRITSAAMQQWFMGPIDERQHTLSRRTSDLVTKGAGGSPDAGSAPRPIAILLQGRWTAHLAAHRQVVAAPGVG
jgi:hypothetical protein